MPIAYTNHALVRMGERGVQPTDVAIILAEPDEIRYGSDGELIARKRLGRRLVEVVYDETDEVRRILTVMIEMDQ